MNTVGINIINKKNAMIGTDREHLPNDFILM